MTTEITTFETFNNELFGMVRGYRDENGEAWLYGNDVAKALGYTNLNQAIQDHVDEDDRKSLKYKANIVSIFAKTLWSNPNDFNDKIMINESGVYSLIFGSNLPKAREFRKWVTSEVLPSIRKHGMYATTQVAEQLINDPSYMIQTLTALLEERKAKELAQAQLEVTKEELRGARIEAESNAKIASLNYDSYIQKKNELQMTSEALVEMKGVVIEKINEVQDLQDYIDKMTNLGESMTAMDVGKFFNISNRKVNELLHRHGYIFKRSVNWYPYADVDEPELFKMVLTRCPDGNYRQQLRFQPKILKIVNKLLLKEKGEK